MEAKVIEEMSTTPRQKSKFFNSVPGVDHSDFDEGLMKGRIR